MSTKINQNQNHETKNSNLNDNKFYNESDYIHYVYKITNLTNNKYYIGVHSLQRKKGKEPLNDGYWGSGIYIKEAIKKDGKKNFKKEILKTFSTREEALEEEKRLVTIKEVNDPNCYNKTTGGKKGGSVTTGKIVVRLKADPTKVVIIDLEDYYNNKEIYLNANIHLDENGNLISRERIKMKIKTTDTMSGRPIFEDERGSRYIRKIKISEDDTFYNTYYKFINKNTLEIKKVHHKERPQGPYDIWYPIIFLDKTHNIFISKEILDKGMKQYSNREKLANYFGISKRSLKTIIEYYENIYGIKYSNSYTKSKSKRFSGKLKITNGKENKVIERSSLKEYEEQGWIRGWISKKLPDREDVINFYSNGNNIENCMSHFQISRKFLLFILGISLDIKLKTFNKDGKVIKLRVTDEIEKKLLANGWFRGRKP